MSQSIEADIKAHLLNTQSSSVSGTTMTTVMNSPNRIPPATSLNLNPLRFNLTEKVQMHSYDQAEEEESSIASYPKPSMRFKYLHFNLTIECTPSKTTLLWHPHTDVNKTIPQCVNFQMHYNNKIDHQLIELGVDATRKLLELYSDVRERLRRSCMAAHNAVVLPMRAHP